MSLMNSYLQVISEGKASAEVKSNLKAGSDFFGNKPKNEDDTLENVTLDKPSTGLSQGAEPSKPKPLNVKFEATNPFDALYKKVLAQENLGWEDEAQADEEGASPETSLSFAGDTATGEGEVEISDEESTEEEEGGEDEGDPMQEVLDALKAAVSALERVLGSEEEEEEEGEGQEEEMYEEDPLKEEDESGESGESGESEEEVEVEEEVDAQELGHALVDLEKLAASLNSPKSQVVKGAVPVNKSKAQVPKGAKQDGSLSELGDHSDKLENKKNNNTGLVKTGKTIFEQ